MKILCFDVGTKRIGVARVDTAVRIAIPETTIEVDGQEFERIAALSRRYQTKLFVIGLPRNLSGQETAQSNYSRQFAEKLKSQIPDAKIRFQDESLTSVEAKSRLRQAKPGYQKADVDAEAAVLILQDFIEHYQPRPATPKILSSVQKTKVASSKDKKSHSSSLKTKIARGLIFASGGLVLLFLGAFFYYQDQLKPVEVANCQSPDPCRSVPVSFVIENGQSAKEIADNLQSAGLIRNSLVFQVYLRLNNLGPKLKTGTHKLYPFLSSSEIAIKLIAATPSEHVFRFTFTPGETLVDFKNRLLKLGYTSEQVDIALAKKYDHPVLKDLPNDRRGKPKQLEGYLFPETYEFYKKDSVEKIITTMLTELQKQLDQKQLLAGFQAQNLNLDQAIRLASIVQKEANSPDQPGVAQVFLSRLRQNISLGSDVTSQYAVDLVDPKPRKIYTDNSKILNYNSCYNTRFPGHRGLPCGAISSPGLSALMAVAQPAKTDYLYFLTGDDDRVYYGKTEFEHNQNIHNHCKKNCLHQL